MASIDVTRKDISSVDLYIPSSARTRGVAEDFSYIVGDAPINNVIAYNLNSVRVPATVYVIESGINTFELTEGANPPVSVILPEGYYDTDVLLTTNLKNALDSAGTQAYTVSVDPLTYKLTISAAGAFSLDFTAEPIGVILGFSRNTVTPSASSITSTYPIQRYAPNVMYLESKILSNSTLSGHSIENNRPSNIIAQVSRDESTAESALEYRLPRNYDTVQKTRPFSLYELDLKLLFPTSFEPIRPVDLRGNEWSLWITVFYMNDTGVGIDY